MNKGREVFVTDFWDSTSNLGTIRNTRGATYIGFIVLCKGNKKDQSNNREGFRQGGIEYKYQTALGLSYLQSKFSNPLSHYPNFLR